MLRDYQQNAIDTIRGHFANGVRRVLFQLPTGGGKTLTCAHMLKTCNDRGMRGWFLVHRRELVKQSVAAFDKVGLRHGVIAAGWAQDTAARIQIASIDTLMRRINTLCPPSLIVVDECHHAAARSWSDLLNSCQSSYIVGLSATPCRTDGAGLGNHFDALVQGPSVRWLIDNQFLAPFKIYAPATISTDGIHTRGGDFARDELTAAADRPVITGCAVEHYKKLCPVALAVVFCVSREHSRNVTAQFNAAGIRAEHVDGETPTDERDAAISRFSRRETRILCNVDLFGEGFDLPSMEAVILLRPTKSLALYRQQVGRCLRYQPGKTAIILDHAGNTARHGFPDDETTWTLEGDSRRGKKSAPVAPSVKVCPRCFAAQFSGRSSCAYCGGLFPVDSREVEEKEGELVEVQRREARRAQGRCKTMADLIEEGRRRGMKNPHGWAYHVYNSRKRA